MSEEYTTVRDALSPEAYHTPAPLRPEDDPRAKALDRAGKIAVFGLVLFASMGYGLSGLDLIPERIIDILTLMGGITLAIGSEAGTRASLKEVFRKVGNDTVSFWDWATLGVSMATTVMAVITAMVRLRENTAPWAVWVETDGPLVLIVLATLDWYFLYTELGLYVGSYDIRFDAWEGNYHTWCHDEAIARGWATGASRQSVVNTNGTPLAPVAVGVDEYGTSIMAGGPGDISHGSNGNKPHANVKAWRPIVAAMKPEDWPQSATEIQAICQNLGYAEVALTTARRWFKEEMPF